MGLNELSDAIVGARRDFESDDTVRLAEWHLSRTESLILAYAAVRHGLETFDDEEESDPLAEASEAIFLNITDWGPRETAYDTPFNPQSQRRSGIWFKADDVPDGLAMYFDRMKVPTTMKHGSFTISVKDPFRKRVIENAGRYEIVAVEVVDGRKQLIGSFVVLEPATNFATLPGGSMSKVFLSREWLGAATD
jgi:hypothetical protein